MEKGYAYIDKGGILHIVKEMQTAISYAMKGTKVLQTEYPHEKGYPIADGEQVIVYSDTCMKHSGDGPELPVIPALAELYNMCRG